MKTTARTRIIYSVILLLITACIWNLIYGAQFLEYDENYGNLLTAFFLSVIATVVLAILWFKWQYIIKACRWQTILFLIASSPATLAVVFSNYPTVFGTALQN